jgi:molybdopterin molybdotransferase/putative molybdopterin biosynthesis protein
LDVVKLSLMKLPTRIRVLEELFSRVELCPSVEAVPIPEAAGRVLAENQYSQHNLAVVRASMMDGIAVKSECFKDGIPNTDGWTLYEDYVRADTGDDFDDRFDAVIKIEEVVYEDGNRIQIAPSQPVVPGLNVNGCGSTLRKGDLLMRANRSIRPTDLAALIMGGITEVPVYRKPRVAFIPTGSELIPLGTVLTRGKNIDSNSLLAKTMLEEMGAVPILYPITMDDPELLRKNLLDALDEADVVIINGGSSKGCDDYNTRLLQEEGKLLFHGVAAAPGRPMGIAVIGNKPVINVAGPSLAAFYGLDWCIRSIVYRLLSLPLPKRQRVVGTLTEDLRCPAPMEFINRVEVREKEEGGYEIQPIARDAGNMAAVMSTNALFISPIGEDFYRAGTQLEVELLRGTEYLNK